MILDPSGVERSRQPCRLRPAVCSLIVRSATLLLLVLGSLLLFASPVEAERARSGEIAPLSWAKRSEAAFVERVRAATGVSADARRDLHATQPLQPR
jgi:hypothetical protein